MYTDLANVARLAFQLVIRECEKHHGGKRESVGRTAGTWVRNGGSVRVLLKSCEALCRLSISDCNDHIGDRLTRDLRRRAPTIFYVEGPGSILYIPVRATDTSCTLKCKSSNIPLKIARGRDKI